MSLSAFLKSKGYADIRLLNGQTPRGMTDEEILGAVREFQPDLVGFTVHSILYYNACRLAGRIKEEAPSAKVVFGGPHLTEFAIEAASQPAVDFAVFGEGEYTLHEVDRGDGGQARLEDVAGLAFKKNGEIIKNPARTFPSLSTPCPCPTIPLRLPPGPHPLRRRRAHRDHDHQPGLPLPLHLLPA